MTPTPTEIADSLLPCPFPHLGKELLHGSWPAKHQFWIHCPCGAMGPHADSPAKAIAAWNRRATSRGHRAAAEEIADGFCLGLQHAGGVVADDKRLSLIEAVTRVLSRRFPTLPCPELAKEFDALAEKATRGEAWRGRRIETAADACAFVPVEVDGGSVARVVTKSHISHHKSEEETLANAAFIAWCFNHRAEILRALGGVVGGRYAEGYAAAREDAAKAFDEAAAQFSHSALDADLSYAQVCRDHATATRALKPHGGEE